MLELDRVAKRFRAGAEEVRAVDGVSLRVAAGEMVALHGPSGSGKTTLLLLVAALLAPDEGAIRFDGRDLSTLGEAGASEYLHRDVGFIYQSPALMPRVSAIENASMKLIVGGMAMRDAQQRTRPWLERLGLGDSLHRTPEQLSAGERQRVAIARALAGEPRLILADEPTGNLDSARSVEIATLLGAVAHERGAAVLLVTHDIDAARIADRRFTLRDGTLHDGALQDRTFHDASPHDASPHDASPHDASPHDGALRDGALRNASLRDPSRPAPAETGRTGAGQS